MEKEMRIQVTTNMERTDVQITCVDDRSCLGYFNKKYSNKYDWDNFCQAVATHYGIGIPSTLIEYPDD